MPALKQVVSRPPSGHLPAGYVVVEIRSAAVNPSDECGRFWAALPTG